MLLPLKLTSTIMSRNFLDVTRLTTLPFKIISLTTVLIRDHELLFLHVYQIYSYYK